MQPSTSALQGVELVEVGLGRRDDPARFARAAVAAASSFDGIAADEMHAVTALGVEVHRLGGDRGRRAEDDDPLRTRSAASRSAAAAG